MADKKSVITRKFLNATTPKGEAKFVWIHKPNTEHDEDGELFVQMYLDHEDEAVQAWVAKLTELRDEAYQEAEGNLKGKALKDLHSVDILKTEYDDEGEETGRYYISAKLKGVAKKKAAGKQSKVIVLDAKRKPLKVVPNIGNGSLIRLVCSASPYYMAKDSAVGVSLYLSKLQLINLVEFAGGDDGLEDEDGFSRDDLADSDGLQDEDGDTPPWEGGDEEEDLGEDVDF